MYEEIDESLPQASGESVRVVRHPAKNQRNEFRPFNFKTAYQQDPQKIRYAQQQQVDSYVRAYQQQLRQANGQESRRNPKSRKIEGKIVEKEVFPREYYKEPKRGSGEKVKKSVNGYQVFEDGDLEVQPSDKREIRLYLGQEDLINALQTRPTHVAKPMYIFDSPDIIVGTKNYETPHNQEYVVSNSYNVGKTDIDALNSLIGKSPVLQLQGLNHLLATPATHQTSHQDFVTNAHQNLAASQHQAYTYTYPKEYTPITEHVVDHPNPVKPQVAQPLQFDNKPQKYLDQQKATSTQEIKSVYDHKDVSINQTNLPLPKTNKRPKRDQENSTKKTVIRRVEEYEIRLKRQVKEEVLIKRLDLVESPSGNNRSEEHEWESSGEGNFEYEEGTTEMYDNYEYYDEDHLSNDTNYDYYNDTLEYEDCDNCTLETTTTSSLLEAASGDQPVFEALVDRRGYRPKKKRYKKKRRRRRRRRPRIYKKPPPSHKYPTVSHHAPLEIHTTSKPLVIYTVAPHKTTPSIIIIPKIDYGTKTTKDPTNVIVINNSNDNHNHGSNVDFHNNVKHGQSVHGGKHKVKHSHYSHNSHHSSIKGHGHHHHRGRGRRKKPKMSKGRILFLNKKLDIVLAKLRKKDILES